MLRCISENAVPKAMTLNEIVHITQKDYDLQSVITAVKTNRMKIVY